MIISQVIEWIVSAVIEAGWFPFVQPGHVFRLHSRRCDSCVCVESTAVLAAAAFLFSGDQINYKSNNPTPLSL